VLGLTNLGAILSIETATELCSARGRTLDTAITGDVPGRALSVWWASQELGAVVLQRLQAELDVTVREASGSQMWLRLPCEGGICTPLRVLERIKADGLLEDYSVAQSSLEQIFNHLAASTQQQRVREGMRMNSESDVAPLTRPLIDR
jgi:hypothetical protein